MSAIHACVRALLPDDEPVVIRYIVVVAVLLTRVAQSDGRFLDCELAHLQVLFQHVDRMPPDGIGQLCAVLNEQVPELSDDELELCYRELRTLCDAGERQQIMRLLASQATSDGAIGPPEHSALMAIAAELDVPADTIEEMEIEALSSEAPPIARDSRPPHRPSWPGA